MAKSLICKLSTLHNQWRITDAEYKELLNKLEEHDRELLKSNEQRFGTWIIHSDDLFPSESTQECDQCNEHQSIDCSDNFCPECGAKMIGIRHGFGGDHG